MLDTKLHFSNYVNMVLLFKLQKATKMMNDAWAYDRIKMVRGNEKWMKLVGKL